MLVGLGVGVFVGVGEGVSVGMGSGVKVAVGKTIAVAVGVSAGFDATSATGFTVGVDVEVGEGGITVGVGVGAGATVNSLVPVPLFVPDVTCTATRTVSPLLTWAVSILAVATPVLSELCTTSTVPSPNWALMSTRAPAAGVPERFSVYTMIHTGSGAVTAGGRARATTTMEPVRLGVGEGVPVFDEGDGEAGGCVDPCAAGPRENLTVRAMER